jgi:hypothetical protein
MPPAQVMPQILYYLKVDKVTRVVPARVKGAADDSAVAARFINESDEARRISSFSVLLYTFAF